MMTDVVKEKLRQAAKQRWADPAFREKVTAKIKATCNDVEFKRQTSEILKQSWTPERRERAKVYCSHAHTEETKAVLRAKCGRPQSEKNKLVNSVRFRGRKFSPETIEKMKTVGIEKRYKTNIERYGDARGPLKDTLPEKMFEKSCFSQDYLKQQPVKGILVDFYFPQTKTCVFVDGCYWHNCPDHFKEVPFPENIIRDRNQDGILSAAGYKVVRIWEHDLIRNAGPYR